MRAGPCHGHSVLHRHPGVGCPSRSALLAAGNRPGCRPRIAAALPARSSLPARLFPRAPPRAAPLRLATAAVRRKVTGRQVVEVAHMELAEPTIEQAVGRCAAAGARRVVVAPYFLSRGRHVQVGAGCCMRVCRACPGAAAGGKFGCTVPAEACCSPKVTPVPPEFLPSAAAPHTCAPARLPPCSPAARHPRPGSSSSGRSPIGGVCGGGANRHRQPDGSAD